MTPKGLSQLVARNLPAQVAIVLALFACGLWHLHVIDRRMPLQKSDLHAVQVGVSATLQGRNPYAAEVTRQIQTRYYGRALGPGDRVNTMCYAYPLYTAFVLFPLAVLSFSQAQLLFWILVPGFALAAIVLWLRTLGLGLGWRRLLMVGALMGCSWPFLWAMRLQQVSLCVFILVLFGLWLLNAGRPGLAGVAFALCLFKPQLSAPLLLWLVVQQVRRRDVRFAAGLLAPALAMLAGASLWMPNWTQEWKKNIAELAASTGQRPALATVFGSIPGTVLAVCLAGAALRMLWNLRASRAGSMEFAAASGVILACTLALIPTDLPMIYNQIFLLPAAVVFVFVPTRAPLQVVAGCLLAWCYLSVPLVVIAESLSSRAFWQGLPFFDSLLPAALTLAISLRYFAGFDEHRGNVRARLPG